MTQLHLNRINSHYKSCESIQLMTSRFFPEIKSIQLVTQLVFQELIPYNSGPKREIHDSEWAHDSALNCMHARNWQDFIAPK